MGNSGIGDLPFLPTANYPCGGNPLKISARVVSAGMALICAGARPWARDLGDACACPSWARAMARKDVALAMALIVAASSSQKVVLLQCAKELYRWNDKDLKKLANMVTCISE